MDLKTALLNPCKVRSSLHTSTTGPPDSHVLMPGLFLHRPSATVFLACSCSCLPACLSCPDLMSSALLALSSNPVVPVHLEPGRPKQGGSQHLFPQLFCYAGPTSLHKPCLPSVSGKLLTVFMQWHGPLSFAKESSHVLCALPFYSYTPWPCR